VRLLDGSGVNREVHAPFCERPGVQFLRPTCHENTLKTKGYHFEHNYGHGHQHLSSLLASLILLAFLVHTVLEWMDGHYQLLHQKLPSRQRLFSDIRTLTSYLRIPLKSATQSSGRLPPSPAQGLPLIGA
jgi:hypothetical protein